MKHRLNNFQLKYKQTMISCQNVHMQSFFYFIFLSSSPIHNPGHASLHVYIIELHSSPLHLFHEKKGFIESSLCHLHWSWKSFSGGLETQGCYSLYQTLEIEKHDQCKRSNIGGLLKLSNIEYQIVLLFFCTLTGATTHTPANQKLKLTTATPKRLLKFMHTWRLINPKNHILDRAEMLLLK